MINKILRTENAPIKPNDQRQLRSDRVTITEGEREKEDAPTFRREHETEPNC